MLQILGYRRIVRRIDDCALMVIPRSVPSLVLYYTSRSGTLTQNNELELLVLPPVKRLGCPHCAISEPVGHPLTREGGEWCQVNVTPAFEQRSGRKRRRGCVRLYTDNGQSAKTERLPLSVTARQQMDCWAS